MRKLFLGLTVVFLYVTALGAPLQQYQCANCENQAKTESSVSEDYDEIYLEEDQIITAIYIKAGKSCAVPDGTCYQIVGGGMGFNYVQIERVGSGPECQAISHLEVCFSIADPTNTPTNTPEEPTSTSTVTNTPPVDPTETPTPTDVEMTPTNTEEWKPTRTQKSGNG